MYNGTVTKRAIRLLNGRKQVLIQDEITAAPVPVQWSVSTFPNDFSKKLMNLIFRLMHTNATVVISNGGKTATLTLNKAVVIAQLLSPATASFTTQNPVRIASDPPLPTDAASADQPNTGTVLTVAVPTGSSLIQVLFK